MLDELIKKYEDRIIDKYTEANFECYYGTRANYNTINQVYKEILQDLKALKEKENINNLIEEDTHICTGKEPF